jgi:hypothetical protein
VPPLQGYDAVLKERGVEWPTGFKVPTMPTPTKIDGAAILSADIQPELAVADFLDVFGADMQTGSAFTDAAGSTLAITKALFQDGKGEFKWLSSEKKLKRLQYINLLAMTLIEPDEIWWVWVKDHHEKGRWRLKRRYLRAFEVDGTNEYAVSVFEWGRTGWTGSTAFMTTQPTEALQEAYFNKQRNGRLVFKK